MADNPQLINARLRRKYRDGIVDVFTIKNRNENIDLREIVDAWPCERIIGLREKTKVPVQRIVALLGITQSGYSKLCSGTFTPSPNLCRRMQELEDMAERGELHNQYIPSTFEMRRRMALFRSWWLSQPPTVDMPRVTCHLQLRWGKAGYQLVTIPIKHMPQLRLKELAGLTDAIRVVTVALRKLAIGNSRILWREGERSYWEAYSKNTLPKIVVERAKIQPKAQKRYMEKYGKNNDPNTGV